MESAKSLSQLWLGFPLRGNVIKYALFLCVKVDTFSEQFSAVFRGHLKTMVHVVYLLNRLKDERFLLVRDVLTKLQKTEGGRNQPFLSGIQVLFVFKSVLF